MIRLWTFSYRDFPSLTSPTGKLRNSPFSPDLEPSYKPVAPCLARRGECVYVCMHGLCMYVLSLDSLAQHGPEVFKLFPGRDSGPAENHRTSSVWRGGPAVVVPDVH